MRRVAGLLGVTALVASLAATTARTARTATAIPVDLGDETTGTIVV